MPAAEENTDRRLLREYLLGQLPDDLATRLDARLFAEDALCRELEEEQNALVEDLVYGHLSAEEEVLFQEQCARSPLLNEKVVLLRTLLSALEREHSSATTLFFLRGKLLLKVLSPALAVLICVVFFVYAHPRHREAALISQAASLLPPAKVVAPSSTHTAPIVTVFLSANVARSSASLPKISIPPAGTALELQVEIRVPSPSATDWDIALLRGGEVVQSSSHLPLHRLAQETYLSLIIDSAYLHAGSYSLRYSPHFDPTAMRYRSFEVTK